MVILEFPAVTKGYLSLCISSSEIHSIFATLHYVMQNDETSIMEF